jgi:hypothetical protein
LHLEIGVTVLISKGRRAAAAAGRLAPEIGVTVLISKGRRAAAAVRLAPVVAVDVREYGASIGAAAAAQNVCKSVEGCFEHCPPAAAAAALLGFELL